MKTNNIVKMLVILVIVLSIGLVITTIKLTTMGKGVVNKDTPIVVDKNPGDIVEKIKEYGEKSGEKKVEPIEEIPFEEIEDNPEDNQGDKAPIIDNKPSEEKEAPKENKPSKEEKPKKDNSNNKDKPDKDKPNKDKSNKDNKKDKKDKEEKKNDKKDKKDKSKEEKAIVNPKYISTDEATKIGLNKVGDGAKLIKIESDLDDNPPKYNLEIILGNYEYEIEIHAITGAIIDFEKDEVED